MAVVEPAWSAKHESFITSKKKPKKQNTTNKQQQQQKRGAELDLLQSLLDQWSILSKEVK